MDSYAPVATESVPAAIQIGLDLLAQGNLLGEQLIDSARLAFMDGMTSAAAVASAVAFLNAVLVKLYMPSSVDDDVSG